MGAPFLIGETHATTHVELQAQSLQKLPDLSR